MNKPGLQLSVSLCDWLKRSVLISVIFHMEDVDLSTSSHHLLSDMQWNFKSAMETAIRECPPSNEKLCLITIKYTFQKVQLLLRQRTFSAPGLCALFIFLPPLASVVCKCQLIVVFYPNCSWEQEPTSDQSNCKKVFGAVLYTTL